MWTITGQKGDYQWLSGPIGHITGLVEFCPEIIVDYFLFNTFNGKNSLQLRGDPVRNGLQEYDFGFLSSKIANVNAVEFSDSYEWYGFNTARLISRYEVFAKIYHFSLSHDPSPMMGRFWKQIEDLKPEIYLGEGHHFTFVTKNEYLYERALIYFGIKNPDKAALTEEPDDPEEWWGYHQDFGWVVLDRRMYCNKSGSSELRFISCRDWKVFVAQRDEWKPPRFIYFKPYLTARCSTQAPIEKLKMQMLRGVYKHVRDQFLIQSARENHRALLNRLGISRPIRLINYHTDNWPRRQKGRRVTHCWNCQYGLDSAVDLECEECNWLLCACGACGCGYTGPVRYR